MKRASIERASTYTITATKRVVIFTFKSLSTPYRIIESAVHFLPELRTTLPSTQTPSTLSPSTFTPTTQTATSLTPTTQTATSLTPSSLAPSTQIPTTRSSTTQFPSSILSSTQVPTTRSSTTQSPPSLAPTQIPCIYQVLNCQNCPKNAPLFDLTQGNVSCIFFQNEWRWTFTPNNGTLTNTIVFENTTVIIQGNEINNGNLSVSLNSVVFIQGNITNNGNASFSENSLTVIQGVFIQNSGGETTFTYNPSSSNSSKASAPLVVGGCVSINGNISLNLQTQPQQGTTNLQIISYNCSQQVNISSSQIQVIPNYNGSSCDTINSQAINQPDSLGVSLTSTLGNKCNGGNGKNLGVIIGLSVGIPCGLTLTTFIIISILRRKQGKQISKVKAEIDEKNKKFHQNQKFKGKTQWTENQMEMETI